MHFFSYTRAMHDTINLHPDMPDLYQVAASQQGHFTTQQAHARGVSDQLLSHHVRTGRLIRAYRGVYRFRDYPSNPREHVAAAWLAVGKDIAVVSHESALDLLEMTDVIPNAIDITIPRSKRYLKSPPGITVHTTNGTLEPADITRVDGVPVTSPARTIVDVAEHGLSPEHVEVAVAQALFRGTSTARRLRKAAESSSDRVRRMIEQAIERAES